MNGDWSVRRAGSPQQTDGRTPRAILRELADGTWDAADEVRGPGEPEWRPMEAHPEFADAVEEITADPPKEPEEETHLDMNPLIDVALVLLIFFILTATYQTLRRSLNLPGGGQSPDGGAKQQEVEYEDIRERVILLGARMRDGGLQLSVDEKPVAEDKLDDALAAAKKSGRVEVLLHQEHVPWEKTVAILNAAKRQGLTQILWDVPPPDAGEE